MRLAVLFLLLAGCTPVASDLDAAVARGQLRWRAACGRTPEPSSWRVVPAPLECASVPNALGCHYSSTNAIEVSSTVAASGELEQVVVHELGHVLGAGHVPPGRGVLSAQVANATDTITAWDLSQVPLCRWRRPEPVR